MCEEGMREGRTDGGWFLAGRTGLGRWEWGVEWEGDNGR